jgi:hypothetical protein
MDRPRCTVLRNSRPAHPASGALVPAVLLGSARATPAELLPVDPLPRDLGDTPVEAAGAATGTDFSSRLRRGNDNPGITHDHIAVSGDIA